MDLFAMVFGLRWTSRCAAMIAALGVVACGSDVNESDGGAGGAGGADAEGGAGGEEAPVGGSEEGAGGEGGETTSATGGSGGGEPVPEPTCTDDVQNGDETDVDCGGTCEARCELGQECATSADCADGLACSGATCSTPIGCGELAEGSADGTYSIDPDGEGPLEEITVRCDMTTDGGGWTVIAYALDETYPTPPPAYADVAAFPTYESWIAYEWQSGGESYYISLEAFAALTNGATEVMQLSKDVEGNVLAQLKYADFDYDVAENESVIGACTNLVGSPCQSAYSWNAFPPGFGYPSAGEYCNQMYPTMIWGYHNDCGCASDSGLFRYNGTSEPKPQLVGSYTVAAHENFIMIR